MAKDLSNLGVPLEEAAPVGPAPGGVIPISMGSVLEQRAVAEGALTPEGQTQLIAQRALEGQAAAQQQALAKQARPDALAEFEQQAATGQWQGPQGPNALSAFETEHAARMRGVYRADPYNTMLAQGGRGVADAILAPGALLGAGFETAGQFFDNAWMKDFGRDLGESSSGKAYIQMMSELVNDEEKLAPGTYGDTAATRAAKALAAQEREYPTLSTLSRIAGQAIFATAGGIAGTLPKSLGTFGAISAAEGAGGGAQAAYENGAPLEDVLTSTVLGSAIGGAAGYGAGALGRYAASKMPSFGQMMSEAAAEQTGAVGRAAKKAWATVDEAGGAQAQKVINEVMDAKESIAKAVREAGPNPTIREAAEKAARSEVAERLTTKVKGDVASWALKEPDAMTKFLRRPQYLSQISDDLAQDFANVRTVAPSLDFDFDASLASKLMKEADAPLAIGKVQTRVNEALGALPPEHAELVPMLTRLQSAAVSLNQIGAPARALGRGSKRAYAEGASQAMQEGHNLIRMASELANSQNETVRTFAQTLRGNLVADLTDESAFGGAAKLYRQSTVDGDPLVDLLDPGKLRERLRGLGNKGELQSQVELRNRIWNEAYEARAALSGSNVPRDATKALENLVKRVDAAENALTLDGMSTGRVLDQIGNAARKVPSSLPGFTAREAKGGVMGFTLGDVVASKLAAATIGHAIGGLPGAAVSVMVANRIAPIMNDVMRPYLRAGAQYVKKAALPAVGEAIGFHAQSGHVATGRKVYEKVVREDEPKPSKKFTVPESLTAAQRQDRYRDRMSQLDELTEEQLYAVASDAFLYTHDVTPEMSAMVAQGMNRRVTQLLEDMPKPQAHIGGPAYEVLSRQDLKRSEAMWDATFEPMGMFEDFQRGVVDYARVEYTWKQYPGMQQAVQAGMLDIMAQQMSDEERAGIPARVLSQIDYLGGGGGWIHGTNTPEFSESMSKLGQAEAQRKPPPRPPATVKSPMAEHKRTFTEKLSH